VVEISRKREITMKIKVIAAVLIIALLSACSAEPTGAALPEGVTEIKLSDSGITANGDKVGADPSADVYTAKDIVYYEQGQDFTYGEGTEADAHSAEEAASHTVLHITKPGAYSLTGKLTAGQVAVDLGEDAEDDPNAVVTLYLNGADITCTVAPAVIFYNVYECGTADEDTATKDVDTSKAGANVVIVDGTENNITGAYVARIYKPGTLEMSEDGTEVLDAKKLHKYDAAFYSKMSMNVSGGDKGTGVLNIDAENEGLDSELHLTINGGNINIRSGNDGINTNEDYVSVTTVNGGNLNILVTGETGEGDGIDSNGWLVINGGTVTAAACSTSGDAGIDSDMGIHITGGTVIATGHMLDAIENGGQNYAVFTFSGTKTGSETVTLKNEKGDTVMEHTPENAYSILVYSSPELTEGTYTLWSDGTQLSAASGGMGGMMGRPGGFGGDMEMPEGFEPPEGMEIPEGFEPGQTPEGMTPPEGFEPGMGGGFGDGQERPEMPEGMEPGEMPEGGMGGMMGRPGAFGGQGDFTGEASTNIQIAPGGNMFTVM